MGKTVAFTARIDEELHRLLCRAARLSRKKNSEWLRDLIAKELSGIKTVSNYSHDR